MKDKKVYYIKAKVVMSPIEKEDDINLEGEHLEEVVITDVEVKNGENVIKNAYDSMCVTGKRYYAVTKDKLGELKEAGKVKIEEAKANSTDYQEYANAEGAKEKTKVVVSHIKRDSKAAYTTLREKSEKLLKLMKEKRTHETPDETCDLENLNTQDVKVLVKEHGFFVK